MAQLWDEPIIDPAHRSALDELRAAKVTAEMTLVLLDFYRNKAVELSGDPGLCVDLVDDHKEASYVPDRHRLDLFAGAVADAPGLDWLDLLHGECWHELAHALFSQPQIWEGAQHRGELNEAANLLEDIRIGRRLLEGHADARSWLRANVAGRWFLPEVIQARSDAAMNGWGRIATILCGRAHSGVVTAAESGRLRALFPEATPEAFAACDRVWAEYSALSDEDAASGSADRLIGELAAYF